MSKRIGAANIRLKRAYQSPAEGDGARILIDRLWPRGMTKKSSAINELLKDVAPSNELRQWFGHVPLAGRNSGAAMLANFVGTLNISAGSENWPVKVLSPSCTQHMMKFTMMP